MSITVNINACEVRFMEDMSTTLALGAGNWTTLSGATGTKLEGVTNILFNPPGKERIEYVTHASTDKGVLFSYQDNGTVELEWLFDPTELNTNMTLDDASGVDGLAQECVNGSGLRGFGLKIGYDNAGTLAFKYYSFNGHCDSMTISGRVGELVTARATIGVYSAMVEAAA